MKNREPINYTEHKYHTLLDVLTFLKVLVSTEHFTGPSTTQNWARYVLAQFNIHCDVSSLEYDGFVQLVYEFTLMKSHPICLLREQFLRDILSARHVTVQISIEQAEEIILLIKDWWGKEEGVKKVLPFVNGWNQATAKDLKAFVTNFDYEVTWNWFIEQNKKYQKFDREELLSLAEAALCFPKQQLIELAKATMKA